MSDTVAGASPMLGGLLRWPVTFCWRNRRLG